MPSKLPSVAAVMTGLLGVFMIVAGFGTTIPGFVHDRVPDQFAPTWNWALTRVMDSPSDELVMIFARGSQIVIASVEWLIGAVMIAATFMPRRRLALTNLGVGLSIGLFGAFMIAMFAVHDRALPWWNQYPAILAWLGVTWIVVAMAERPGSSQMGRSAGE